MKLRLALVSALALNACHMTDPEVKPVPGCAKDADAGTSLEVPCAGKGDGLACCLGSKAGVCASGRCVLK